MSETTTTTQEEYLTVKQVARRLNYSRQTILRRIADGQLEAMRSNGTSGHIRISREAFNRFCMGERK